MDITRKLVLGSTVLAAVPVLVMSAAGGIQTAASSRAMLEAQARNQLIAIRESKKAQIGDYFETIRRQIVTLAQQRSIVVAASELGSAFANYRDETGADPAELRTQLESYYRDRFAAEYARRNAGNAVDIGPLMSSLDADSIALQHAYIHANPNPLGSKDALDAADETSSYGRVHRQLHPILRSFLVEFGFYDIFIADPGTGDVVYSVFKELDFSTSLTDGPYASTGIGEAFRAANAAAAPGFTSLTDFRPYGPSYDDPASFIATPIFDGTRKVGVLIFQMPIDRINAVMTSSQRWRDVGLGESGESYLVGDDSTMRSISRFLIEDPAAYVAGLKANGTSAATLSLLESKGTSIGLQTIDTPGARLALEGASGFGIFDDYRGVEVMSAYAPLDVLGMKWAILSEIDADEALAPAIALRRTIAIGAAGLGLVLIASASFLAWLFARRFCAPIRRLQRAIEEVERDTDLGRRIGIDTGDEVGAVAAAVDRMLAKFDETVRGIASTSRQLAEAATRLSETTADTNRTIQHQRESTQQVATAMIEMSSTVQDVAGNTSDAAKAATEADSESGVGKRVVAGTTESMEALASEVDRAAAAISQLSTDTESIGAVLDVIRGVADQTNLLALNAAIEAARAGEQGRGFAVVADEVRTLASRTQESTKEIQATIERLQQGARDASAAMDAGRERATDTVRQANGAREALEAIATAVGRISDLNTRIASAAEQQAAVTENTSERVNEISDGAARTADDAAVIESQARSLATLANDLSGLVARFSTSA